MELISSVFPGVDLATAGGFLQLVFVEFGLILAGLAAATLVGSWASDETSGRIEMLLATPLARARWALGGGVAVLAGIVVLTGLTAVGIALGTLSVGGELATPVAGTLALGLYAVGVAGVGLAVAGLFGARYAAPTVAGLTILTWLLDFLGPNLDLPDAVQQLALSSHMGLPMVGVWDVAGIVACVTLGVGGGVVGAWGFTRRDLRS
jgi:ABC-2 type transport system permease protein